MSEVISLETPVAKEVVQAIVEIDSELAALGIEIVDIEMRKVQILAQVKKLRAQRTTVFEAIAEERGLSPQESFSVDHNGVVSMNK